MASQTREEELNCSQFLKANWTSEHFSMMEHPSLFQFLFLPLHVQFWEKLTSRKVTTILSTTHSVFNNSRIFLICYDTRHAPKVCTKIFVGGKWIKFCKESYTGAHYLCGFMQVFHTCRWNEIVARWVLLFIPKWQVIGQDEMASSCTKMWIGCYKKFLHSKGLLSMGTGCPGNWLSQHPWGT